MNFWFWAAAVPALAALVVSWPLLCGPRWLRMYGLAILLLIPVSALYLYQHIGTPAALDQPAPSAQAQHVQAGAGEFGAMIGQLEERLRQQPDDVEGWLLLGRSYKTLQRYAEAEAALRRASQLAPADPLVKVELAEALLFSSGNPEISPLVKAMLEQALADDPQLQKGLWLLGIAEAQAGNEAQAAELWERLLTQVEPGSGIAVSVQQQLDGLHRGQGMQPPASWPGVQVEVLAAESMPELPPAAVLFLIARDPAAPTPPLGVKRVPDPRFPLSVVLSDANSMMPERPISGSAEIELLARLSMSGNPVAQPGDLQSQSVQVSIHAGATVQLLLDLN